MRRHVRWLVAGALSFTVASATVGAVSVDASSHGPSPVTIVADTTQWAATHLTHAPHQVRLAAARLIIAEARALITRHDGAAGTSRSLSLAPTATGVPGTIVGGLWLDGYCQNLGFDHSAVNGPIVAPGAAFNWFCITTTGGQTPIVMQAACAAQYPGIVTIAYPQDVNDAYTWVCISPTTGHTTNGTSTVYTYPDPTGAIVVITSPDGSASLNYDSTTTNGTIQIDSGGNGYIADGGMGSTLPI